MKLYFAAISAAFLLFTAACKNTDSVSQNANYKSIYADIDTGNDIQYLTNQEKEMIKEINLLRSNPRGYIAVVEQYMLEVQHEKLPTSADLETKQYYTDVLRTGRELVLELKRTTPLPILQPKECMYAAAKHHAEDQRPTGDLDHFGTDGTLPWDRVGKTCSDIAEANENLVGGLANVRETIVVLLIDTGIPNRGHRQNLLHPDWEYIACYEAGQIGNIKNCWIQQFGM